LLAGLCGSCVSAQLAVWTYLFMDSSASGSECCGRDNERVNRRALVLGEPRTQTVADGSVSVRESRTLGDILLGRISALAGLARQVGFLWHTGRRGGHCTGLARRWSACAPCTGRKRGRVMDAGPVWTIECAGGCGRTQRTSRVAELWSPMWCPDCQQRE